MLACAVIAPIPMSTRVQSHYIYGWLSAILLYITTQGVAEFGLRPAPLAVLKILGKTVLGFVGLGIGVAIGFVSI